MVPLPATRSHIQCSRSPVWTEFLFYRDLGYSLPATTPPATQFSDIVAGRGPVCQALDVVGGAGGVRIIKDLLLFSCDRFVSGNSEFLGQIVRWIDGDTCLVDVRAFDVTHHLRVRLARCDAPPVDTPAGLQALATMQRVAPPGTQVRVLVRDRDRYYRLVADLVTADGRSLSDLVG